MHTSSERETIQTRFFYLLFVATLGVFWLTHPFMKYPFDMFRHLLTIGDFYADPDKMPRVTKHYWHYAWAHLFHLLHLDNHTIFLRARIIHIVQITIAFLSVFYFAKTFFSLLFRSIRPLDAAYLGYWATLIWFFLFATYSEGYHLIWIGWYSLTYQVTLPLTLLLFGLTLRLCFNTLSVRKRTAYIIAALLLAAVILTIHSMEFIYYMLYIIVLALLYIDRIIRFAAQHKLIFFIAFAAIAILILNIHTVAHLVSYREPPLLHYLHFDTLPELWKKILRDGHYVVAKLNRAFASVNELYIVSAAALGFTFITTLYLRFRKNLSILDMRMMVFLMATSAFALIPLLPVTAGTAAVLTHVNLVNRFYYSALLFLALPAAAYTATVVAFSSPKRLVMHTIIAVTLVATLFYSTYMPSHRHNFYKNLRSFGWMFDREKIGYPLTDEQIMRIGRLLARYKADSGLDRPLIYSREDIAFVLKYVYGERVYLPMHWNGRLIKVNGYLDAYRRSEKPDKLLFPVPKDFPSYKPYR